MDKPTNSEGGPHSPEYKDLALPELFEMFPDDQTAMEWLEGNVAGRPHVPPVRV